MGVAEALAERLRASRSAQAEEFAAIMAHTTTSTTQQRGLRRVVVRIVVKKWLARLGGAFCRLKAHVVVARTRAEKQTRAAARAEEREERETRAQADRGALRCAIAALAAHARRAGRARRGDARRARRLAASGLRALAGPGAGPRRRVGGRAGRVAV